jgi:glycerol-3-phosphate O-acyltransferase
MRPLIDGKHSRVEGLKILDQIQTYLQNKENVILLANHQTEGDPQAINVLLEKTHPTIGQSMIFVAGERVITDPLAIPFSLGCNLLCIYSKRYIDVPPQEKEAKQLHNQKTMQKMSRLLEEGGKIIYVAPSGGRDRKRNGVIEVAPFDANSVEMFYLMAKKSKMTTHFIPLTLATYELLPPPDTVQVDLGERREAKRTPIHMAFSPPFNMEQEFPGSKQEKREARAKAIWEIVCKQHKLFVS